MFVFQARLLVFQPCLAPSAGLPWLLPSMLPFCPARRPLCPVDEATQPRLILQRA